MQLDKLRNAEGKVWLNVASSAYPLEGFANLDNHILMRVLDWPFLKQFVPAANRNLLEAYEKAARTATMVRHDCRKPLPLPDASVDHILCSHFLEHVFPDEAAGIIADFRRVLKPGATLHVIVPDIAVMARGYVARTGEKTAADEFVRAMMLTKPARGSLRYRLMELSGGFGLQHRWMYDNASMRARVEAAGFTLLSGNETPSAHWRKDDDSVHVVAQR